MEDPRNPKQLLNLTMGTWHFSLASPIKQDQEEHTKHDGEAPSSNPMSNPLNMWSRAGISCSYVLYVYKVLTVLVDTRSFHSLSSSLLQLSQGLSPHLSHHCILKSQHGTNISGRFFNMQKGTLWESKHSQLTLRVWRSTYKRNKTSDPNWNQGTEAYYLFSEIRFSKSIF